MELSWLPKLLALAWLTPLASFVVILFFGKKMGSHGRGAGVVATGAIVFSAICSFTALFGVWLPNHPLTAASHHGVEHAEEEGVHARISSPISLVAVAANEHGQGADAHSEDGAAHGTDDAHHANNPPPPYETGDWYELADFGNLKLTIGYYIDALTVGMFCMVTLIASCVHFYAIGYMHDELHESTDPDEKHDLFSFYTDHEVTLSNGEKLKRPGRYYRFFQYLSLFCFSMLGIVVAGNLAMVFVFWELVGICSYFLIGFYIERHSASTAANKAFIVNRVGDFGMLIGLMALWSSLGTFNFGDMRNDAGEVTEQGMFSMLRTAENDYHLEPTASMEHEGARLATGSTPDPITGEPALAGGDTSVDEPRPANPGQWLLLVAGVGIFCGCVGKSAQFPLHVWLPDAMEGPTPVSALVHSATMVAAGVYLVGRFYPVFTPEALLVIAYVGAITLFIAATIAITATDIKRVLAYSTVSQLGYMMLALGLGGWIAGMFHLFTHAFFKGLLFMCSGSVIHGVHTNDMTQMGGLRKKMPITAYTMLVGTLAISGAGIPLSKFGFSGYYSKDAIIEQVWSFAAQNPFHIFLFYAPIVGAFITAFYMFRLWYLTFAGKPRDQHRYDHAHESPRVMTGPLLVLAALAFGVAWTIPGTNLNLTNLIEQATPIGVGAGAQGTLLPQLTIPGEVERHAPEIVTKAGIAAFFSAAAGVLLATLIYFWDFGLKPSELKQTFKPLHGFLWHKWYFDELYDMVFVQPALLLGKLVSKFDLGIIDSIVHGTAAICRGASKVVDAVFDRTLVDGMANGLARGTWDVGLLLRKLQTGSLRQYVMFIAVGTILLYLAVSFVQKII